MAITPLDIRKKTFSTQLRGFSPDEVKEFLGLIAQELEELRKERSLLAERVDELTAKTEGYARTEKLLQETLVTAQKATGELREAARKEADAIIAQARTRADEMKLGVERQISDLRQQIASLETKKSTLVDEIRGVCQAYLSMAERQLDRQHDRNLGPDTGKRPGNTR